MEPKYLDVNLLRRDELPERLPERPEQLAELPQVRMAFESLYRRPPSQAERQCVRVAEDWVVVRVQEEKTILTTGEVAVKLGYSDDQIRRMCEDGRFDGDATRSVQGAFRACVGAHWRIPGEAVDLFLERRRSHVKRR